MIKRTVMVAVWVLWTLLCIYGTYDNTVKGASVESYGAGYLVTYSNTGEVHYYTKGGE